MPSAGSGVPETPGNDVHEAAPQYAPVAASRNKAVRSAKAAGTVLDAEV